MTKKHQSMLSYLLPSFPCRVWGTLIVYMLSNSYIWRLPAFSRHRGTAQWTHWYLYISVIWCRTVMFYICKMVRTEKIQWKFKIMYKKWSLLGTHFTKAAMKYSLNVVLRTWQLWKEEIDGCTKNWPRHHTLVNRIIDIIISPVLH